MGKFEIKEVKTGIKFNLKAGNGEVIATSEIYTTEAACRKGIESVKANALSAVEDQTVEPIEVLKHPKYEVYLDKAGEYRFRLKARNGEIIAPGIVPGAPFFRIVQRLAVMARRVSASRG